MFNAKVWRVLFVLGLVLRAGRVAGEEPPQDRCCKVESPMSKIRSAVDQLHKITTYYINSISLTEILITATLVVLLIMSLIFFWLAYNYRDIHRRRVIRAMNRSENHRHPHFTNEEMVDLFIPGSLEMMYTIHKSRLSSYSTREMIN